MKHFFSQEKITGIYLEGTTLWEATISGSLSKIEIEALETMPCEDFRPVNKEHIVCVAMPAGKTLMRSLELALTKPKEIEETFIGEAEPLLPFPVDECIIGKIITSTSKTETKLQVLATPKQDVRHYLEELQAIHIDPEILCPKALALSHFSGQFLEEQETPCVLIDISEKETCCLLVKGKQALACRSLPNAMDILGSDEISTSDEALEAIHSYLRELARILLSFQYEEHLPLLFTGAITQHPAKIKLITTFLHRAQVEQIKKPAHIAIDEKKLTSFAVPIGAALSYFMLQKESASINMRSGEFSFTKQWLRWKKELSTYAVLSIAFACALLFLGNQLLEKRKPAIIEKYLALLTTLRIDPNKEAIENLTEEQISGYLDAIEQDLSKQTQEMPLHPDVPRVSDLLAWLSAHPQAKAIKLENLAYTMTKRPEKGKLKEHYQVKVDLEFSAPNVTQAREFHDALLAQNPFIDQKSELKWSAQKEKWRASFMLKDKTQYPQTIVQEEK
jgi:type IV pilus assembly protein PilM